MLKAFAWVPGSGLVVDPPRERFAQVLETEGAVLWVDIEGGKPSELGLLREPFHIHPAAIDEVRDYTPLPKVEDFGSHLLVCLHRVQFDEATRQMALKEIEFVLGKNWLVTVRGDASTSVSEVQDRLRSRDDSIREGPAKLMALIVEVVAGKYPPMVEFLDKEIDQLEEAMLEQRTRADAFGRILALRRTVVALRRSLVPQREVIHRLSREEFRLAAGPGTIHLRAAHDEMYWVLTELEIHRELLTSAFEGQAALTSNKLAVTANRMNLIMEKLTRFATIFMPLTVITGIYGMNFEWMPELRWKYGYFLVLLALVTIGSGVGVYFRRTLPPVNPETGEGTSMRVQTRVWRKGEKPAK